MYVSRPASPGMEARQARELSTERGMLNTLKPRKKDIILEMIFPLMETFEFEIKCHWYVPNWQLNSIGSGNG